MSKILFTFFVLSAVVLSVYSKPTENEEDTVQTVLDHTGRVKRVTCDVLSANVQILGSGGQLNHSACALHCVYLGKRGGYCNSNGVCVCRK